MIMRLDRSERLEWKPEGVINGVSYVPMSIDNMTPTWEEDDMLEHIGMIAGECYGSSKDKDRCIQRAMRCITRGHHSPFEHFNISLKCTVDRGTSHALVRHRHCSFQQSSTIYHNYSRDGHISVVSLPDKDPCTGKDVQGMLTSEQELYSDMSAQYMELLASGADPARARDVLPNALATTLIITTGLREWMYIIQRRCGVGDAVRMHVFAWMLRNWFMDMYPRTTNAFEQWYDEGHGL